MIKFIYKMIILISAFAVSSLQADTLYLRSGKTVHGDVIDQNQVIVRFRHRDGSEVVYQKSSVLRITFGISKEEAVEIRRKKEEEEKKRKEAADKAGKKADAEKRKAEGEAARQAAPESERLKKEEEERQRPGEDKHQKAERERIEGEEERIRREQESEEERLNRSSLTAGQLQTEAKRKRFYLKNAIIPGWGHYAEGNRWRGTLYSTLFWGSAFSALSYYTDAVNYRKASRKIQNQLLRNELILYDFLRKSNILDSEGVVLYDITLKNKKLSKEKQYAEASAAYYGFLGAAAAVYAVQLFEGAPWRADEKPASAGEVQFSGFLLPSEKERWNTGAAVTVRF